MIEPIMYIGIGFLVAGLLVIGVIPLVHARAVRLTLRRLEALTPISKAEIQADKDQLRAEFAMLVSRLELNIERLKAKTASQAAEIGRKSEAIGRLKFELSEKTAALLALEAKENRSAHDVPPFESELAALRAQDELLRDHVGARRCGDSWLGSAAAPISLVSGSANWSVRSAPGPPKRKLSNSVRRSTKEAALRAGPSAPGPLTLTIQASDSVLTLLACTPAVL